MLLIFLNGTLSDDLCSKVSDHVYTYRTDVYSCTSRPDVCQCPPVQTPMNNISENKPRTPVTHVAYKKKLRSVVRSSMHPCPRYWLAIGSAVMYHARATQAFSAGIKCRHCTDFLAVNTCMNSHNSGCLG